MDSNVIARQVFEFVFHNRKSQKYFNNNNKNGKSRLASFSISIYEEEGKKTPKTSRT